MMPFKKLKLSEYPVGFGETSAFISLIASCPDALMVILIFIFNELMKELNFIYVSLEHIITVCININKDSPNYK
jgi:hypothetical protein